MGRRQLSSVGGHKEGNFVQEEETVLCLNNWVLFKGGLEQRVSRAGGRGMEVVVGNQWPLWPGNFNYGPTAIWTLALDFHHLCFYENECSNFLCNVFQSENLSRSQGLFMSSLTLLQA